MFHKFNADTAIGKRLRRLSALVDQDARQIYRTLGVQFEQRWFGILDQLTLNHTMSVKALASALRISHASVSEARKSLETAGYIESHPDPEDGRQRQLKLTSRGREFVLELTPVWKALDQTAEDLNTETDNIAKALDKLDAALSRQSLYNRVMEQLNDHEPNPDHRSEP